MGVRENRNSCFPNSGICQAIRQFSEIVHAHRLRFHPFTKRCDSDAFREEIVRIIDNAGDIEIIGEIQDEQEVLELVLQLEPDILIVDMDMSKRSGIETTRIVRQETERTRIIAFSTSDSSRIAQQFIASGGDVYLLKSMLPSHLVHTIRMVKQAKDWMVFRANLDGIHPI